MSILLIRVCDVASRNYCLKYVSLPITISFYSSNALVAVRWSNNVSDGFVEDPIVKDDGEIAVFMRYELSSIYDVSGCAHDFRSIPSSFFEWFG